MSLRWAERLVRHISPVRDFEGPSEALSEMPAGLLRSQLPKATTAVTGSTAVESTFFLRYVGVRHRLMTPEHEFLIISIRIKARIVIPSRKYQLCK